MSKADLIHTIAETGELLEEIERDIRLVLADGRVLGEADDLCQQIKSDLERLGELVCSTKQS